VDGVVRAAVWSAAASAIADLLGPRSAAAQQVPLTDSRLMNQRETVPSPAGHGRIDGLLVHPRPRAGAVGIERLAAILVIHENSGLNPQIENIARRLALASFMAFAPDALTSLGGYPGNDEKGAALLMTLDRTRVAEDFHAAALWLKNRPNSTGRLGVIGFGFGGDIAKGLAARMGKDLAAVVSFSDRASAEAAWDRTVLSFIKSLT
jgi:carboxymethylenebutenolidase